MKTRYVEVDARWVADMIVVGVRGRFETMIDNELREYLTELIRSAASRNISIVLDFSEVTYLSSAGRQTLVVASKEAKLAGIRIAVASPQPPVYERIQNSRIDTLLPCYLTVSEALEAARSVPNSAP